MSTLRKFFIFGFSTIVMAACTSAPELSTYPERQIDRPYTLPDNVATWTTAAEASRVDDGRGQYQMAISPLIWEQGLSNKWTLEYSPLPLSARYQISKTETQIWGLRFGAGIGYSSSSGVITQPVVGGYHRLKIHNSVAWESGIVYSRKFSNREGAENARLSTGPMLQLDDNKVLTPKVGVGYIKNELELNDEFDGLLISESSAIYVPASLNFKWLFHRQWEYRVGYSVNSVILEDDWRAVHRLLTSFIHFW